MTSVHVFFGPEFLHILCDDLVTDVFNLFHILLKVNVFNVMVMLTLHFS